MTGKRIVLLVRIPVPYLLFSLLLLTGDELCDTGRRQVLSKHGTVVQWLP